MNVVENNKRVTLLDIQLGDMFRSDPYSVFYNLIKIPDTHEYHLASFDGESYYGSPKEENDKIAEIRKGIYDGKLVHYPKSNYLLTLDEK